MHRLHPNRAALLPPAAGVPCSPMRSIGPALRCRPHCPQPSLAAPSRVLCLCWYDVFVSAFDDDMNGPKHTLGTNTRHAARILGHKQHTHSAACNDPTMTSGGDQQLISGKLSRFFDEESRRSNMSSCSMHALTLRMMSFLTVRALSTRGGWRIWQM